MPREQGFRALAQLIFDSWFLNAVLDSRDSPANVDCHASDLFNAVDRCVVDRSQDERH